MAHRLSGHAPASRHSGSRFGSITHDIVIDAGRDDHPVISPGDRQRVQGTAGHWVAVFVPDARAGSGGGSIPATDRVKQTSILQSLNRFVEIGRIVSYNAATNAALVQLHGSSSAPVGPLVVNAMFPRDMTLTGAACLVIMRDAHDASSGIVIAVWPWPGLSAPAPLSSIGAKLWQSAVTSIVLAGATAGSTNIVFPHAYMAAPAVIVTSGDSRLYASTSGVSATGFILTVTSSVGAITGSIPMQWVALGL